jgi:hypothetical protein
MMAGDLGPTVSSLSRTPVGPTGRQKSRSTQLGHSWAWRLTYGLTTTWPDCSGASWAIGPSLQRVGPSGARESGASQERFLAHHIDFCATLHKC